MYDRKLLHHLYLKKKEVEAVRDYNRFHIQNTTSSCSQTMPSDIAIIVSIQSICGDRYHRST